ncbi:MAG: transglutaminaseTgpA domain-containing protein, partial [Planctomycetota bacterium]|nr:transglutaminaseTgpA domain-containing protein [Planctomycetota bacterium]
QGGLISESQTRALDVQLLDGAGRLLTEDRSPLYLRGAVLDSYTGREWKRSRAEDDNRVVIRRLTPGAPHADLTLARRRRVDPDPRTVLVQHIVTRQASRGDTTMFCIWRPRHIQIPGGTDIEFDTVTARLVNKNEAGRFEYTITSYPSSAEDVLIDRNQRGRLPEQPQALTQAARQVLEAQGLNPDPLERSREDDAAAANALQSFVSSACRYTLDVPGAPLKKDPVEYFLFESKEGNCELFAASLAAMCRAVGIDARVIAGYLATEFDPQSSTYIVRQSHAHAWCEVNTAEGVWETFDPTPASTFEAFRDRNASLSARISAFFADMRDKWNQSVVTFDANSQQKLLGVPERDQPWYSEFAEAVSRGTDPEHVRMKNLLSRVLTLTGYAAGGLVGFSVLLVVLRWLWARFRRRGAGEVRHRGWAAARNSPARRLGRELDRAFVRLGAARAPWRSLLSHSRSLAGTSAENRQTLSEASMLVYETAFSSNALDQGRFDRLLKQVRAAGK